ncbi:c-type cytochrome [Sulfurimonas sp.]|uniref:c-type cytochrome n=1 Tax=Sulfurimonas sp. TaxID=2022749 RepID=UPI0025CEE6AB|nr:c-type cytochrome [Sulfurimonas sp.]MCK9454892.1 c-type cytochrome [Sulfurimonas sp.]
MRKTLLILISIATVASATQLFDKCAACHGKNGQRHSQNLTKSIAGMDKKEITTILKEYRAGTRDIYGLGSMMWGQTKRLSDEDIKELSTYISSFTPAVEVATKPKLTKDMTTEEIFQKCAICHGDKGQKRSLGVSKPIAGLSVEEIVKDLKEYKAGTRDTYGQGAMMKGQATKLTEEQMKAVAILIEALPPVQTQEQKDAEEKAKKITQEEIDYNNFMEEYFRTSKDPNETFKAAKKRYEEHKKILKEQNEQNISSN